MDRLGRAALVGILVLIARPALADPTWEKQLSHRPRLTFDGRDRAHLDRTIDRIKNKLEPWATSYGNLRDLAEDAKRYPSNLLFGEPPKPLPRGQP